MANYIPAPPFAPHGQPTAGNIIPTPELSAGCCDFDAKVLVVPPPDYCVSGLAIAFVANFKGTLSFAWFNAASPVTPAPTVTPLAGIFLRPGSYFVQITDDRSSLNEPNCVIIRHFTMPDVPEWNLVYEKRDFCTVDAGPNSFAIPGEITLLRLRGNLEGDYQGPPPTPPPGLNYQLALLPSPTNPPPATIIAAGVSPLPITFGNLDPGTYRLRVNNGRCERQVLITICDNCNDGNLSYWSNETESSAGDCGCCDSLDAVAEVLTQVPQ